MIDDPQHSIGDVPTVVGGGRSAAPASLGDERTVGGAAAFDTLIEDIEIVDLESRYKVEGTLGQGGMGAVYLATDTRLGRKVAVKRILGDAVGNRGAVQRFLTEAKAIAVLSHPHIVQVHDYGRAKDGPFLIMEYVDGGSLLDRCRSGPLPLEEAIELACRICDGLTKAHELGIVHRDIKPANILLTTEGVPKLTDFGLAKREAVDHEMTVAGAVMGTPDFMSPEQRRDAGEVDHRSDLWSLAATIYQMVSGRSPKVIRLNELPFTLQPVLAKALEDAKEHRYQSAWELRDALRSVRRHATAASSRDGVVQEGQCTACGTLTGDLSRKFCRNPSCGASLRVACLACAADIPVWEGVCGECGGNQPDLLAARRTELESRRAEAESLLADMAFDEAIARAADVAGAQPVPALADLRDWAAAFAVSAGVERERRIAAAAESLADARKHAAACDYPAAIQALERIPERLRDAAPSELLADCRARRDESDALIADIDGRVRRRELSGLMPLVERAVELRRDREDLATLRGQLRERRDTRVARARAAMDVGDARKAVGAIANFTAEEIGEWAELRDRARLAVELEDRLASVIKDARADGVVSVEETMAILQSAEAYLAVNPLNERVRTLAERCRSKVADSLLVCNSIGIELRRMPAGSFTMGDASGDPERLPHRVKLTRPFFMGVCAVTNAQWKRVMGCVPSAWKDDDHPVESVSWAEAVEFCDRLTSLPEEQHAGRMYRLPLEAEWEYACRAGTGTAYSFGDDASQLAEHAWHGGNSGGRTHPVGRKEPNPWGLFDMHGNVWEWCSDWYGPYGNGVATNPEGPAKGSFRVFRGGGWLSKPESCRSATRLSIDPASRSDDLGFRIVMSRL